jgi:hypothetical protein
MKEKKRKGEYPICFDIWFYFLEYYKNLFLRI